MGVLNFFSRNYRHLQRYNQIIAVFIKYGFDDLVLYMEENKRLTWIKKLISRQRYQEALQLSKWEKMRRVCEELGPTFVKFGQILSNRPDILPAELIKELEKLQDSVPPEPPETARATIERELKASIEDLFLSFEPDAFASASMAQVHKAVLKTGERVVVKIQRPGIAELIDEDIRIMYQLAEMFQKRIPSLKSFDPPGLVQNFEESIRKEVNFINESVNIQRFSTFLQAEDEDHDGVAAPKVYKEFTTSKVLVMEFVKGIKASDSVRLRNEGYDTHLIAKRLIRSYFRQVFVHGFFHADPHAGNLLIREGNEVVFIDFGMMGILLRKDLENLGKLFMAVKSKEIRRIRKAIEAISEGAMPQNIRLLEHDIFDMVGAMEIQGVHQNEMSTILMKLRDIVIRHNLKVPTHYFLLARSLVAIEGVARQLDPKLDVTRISLPFMVRAVARQFSPVKFTRSVFHSIYDMGIYMEEFPQDLKNAMRRINQGEVKVEMLHKGIDPLVHTLNRISKQIVSAIIISGLVVGSSLIIVADMPPYWGNTPTLGVLGIIIAAVMGFMMVANFFKGDSDQQ